MAKQIAKLLKASLQDTSDLRQIAKQLAGRGRGGDSMLVHITPREAAMLKEAGGAGTTNPDTGLLEFYSPGFGDDGSFNLMQYAAYPDVETGTYKSARELGYDRNDFEPVRTSTPSFQDTYSLVPNNYVPNPRTGRYVSPNTADVSGQYGLNYKQPSRVAFQFNPQVGQGVSQRQLEQAQAAAPPPPLYRGSIEPLPPEVRTAATREPGVLERLKATATSPETLRALGVAGVQALPGILAARQSAAQGRQAKAEMQALAQPYKIRGQEMVEKAQRGELTPLEQQQIQALQARAAQGAAARGGVGAEQVQAQIEAFRQQLLQNKYEMGLQVANIGDQIAVGAIRTGLSADQYVNELTNNYFSNIARSMGGQPQQVVPTQTQRMV